MMITDFEKIATFCLDLGCSCAALHPRTRIFKVRGAMISSRLALKPLWSRRGGCLHSQRGLERSKMINDFEKIATFCLELGCSRAAALPRTPIFQVRGAILS
jgi:hypothetical protein